MSQIKVPTCAEEARAMAALGFKWLEDNAPEQLTQHWRDIKAEAGRAGFIAGAEWWAQCELDDTLHLDEHVAADQYAASIRSDSQP